VSIVRAPRPDTGYLTIRNEVARDEELSLRALGLLTRILSRPDNWETSAERLTSECKEGRDAISTALRELREAGYMRQDRVQDRESGRWSTNTYVYDEPTGRLANALVAPTTDFQGSGDQGSGDQASGFQGLLRTQEKNTQEHDRGEVEKDLLGNDAPAVERMTEARLGVLFDEFWTLYPKKVSKLAARRRWDQLVRRGHDPLEIINGAKLYALSCRDVHRKWIKNPDGWLNAGKWSDELDTSGPSSDDDGPKRVAYTETPPPAVEELPW